MAVTTTAGIGTLNPWVMAGLAIGPELMKGLSSLFAGETPGEKRASETYALAQRKMGKNYYNPDAEVGTFEAANAPRFNKMAEGINNRLGLDSGVAQGELAYQRQGQYADWLLGARKDAHQINQGQDQFWASLMASLGRA